MLLIILSLLMLISLLVLGIFLVKELVKEIDLKQYLKEKQENVYDGIWGILGGKTEKEEFFQCDKCKINCTNPCGGCKHAGHFIDESKVPEIPWNGRTLRRPAQGMTWYCEAHGNQIINKKEPCICLGKDREETTLEDRYRKAGGMLELYRTSQFKSKLIKLQIKFK